MQSDEALTTPEKIYETSFVRNLFDEMARTYGVVNLISSFGFARRWRRQCIRSIEFTLGATVLDLMTGMGELCPDVAKFIGKEGKILALDISPVMCDGAKKQLSSRAVSQCRVIEGNALECPIEDESVDYIVSTFGLKTFNQNQTGQLAKEVNRLLRPGGEFVFLEISVPQMKLLKIPYLAYLNYLIPLIGRLALGNPDNYRLLGEYTTKFGDCSQIADCFSNAQLQVDCLYYFWGCATSIIGRKPN